ncbi:PAS domain-containing sensor histidine kinase [Nitriliruptor alkaliphilus]|uniref:PAS domain-containing sensor histidine kinase n=1 Tax=Nitriliruptor alkaliphilus TaxID=427918 RepID=UPI000696309E|nr:PAS domain-containing protein [Nitriliruptor alkaliphilus]
MDGPLSELGLALLDALPDMAWLSNDDGTVWHVNERFARYTGHDRTWLAEHSWLELVHPEDVRSAEAAWTRATETGGHYEHEHRLRRHDGAYRWFVDRAERGGLAGADVSVHWVGSCTDVHDLHLARIELDLARRRVDEELALLDALHRHAPIGLGVLDRDLRLVRANDALIASGGGIAGETLGRPLQELVPDAWAVLEPCIRRVADRRETVTEIELAQPDPADPARSRWWSVSCYPVELHGELIGVGILAQDQTERIERSAALQASEELRTVAERAASLGLWEFDLRTQKARWSPGLFEVLDVAPGTEPSAEVFEDRIVEEDRPTYHAVVREVLRSREPVTTRYRTLRPDGTVRILEARAACDVEDGHVIRMYGTIQDVTAQVDAWERVARSERLLTEAETVAEVGSFELHLGTGEMRFSPGLHQLLDLGADEPVSLDVWRSFVHPDDRGIQEEQLRRLLETGETDRFQLRIVRPGGEVRRLEIRGVFHRDARGEPERLMGTALDVTERERLRSERVALLERSLTAADRERQRIAEHLHDDTVQALTATLLRLDHAQATGSTEPLGRARHTLEVAGRSLRLNIMELAPVDLAADGVEAAIAAYAEQLLEIDGVDVALEVDLGDEARLRPELLLTSYRIVCDALANVRRHAQGATVVVELRRDGGRLVGEVSDDGAGLGDVADRPGHLGTMRERAELAGGSVTVLPRSDGPGTTVFWWLPL